MSLLFLKAADWYASFSGYPSSAGRRDYRLDVLRRIANWAIFLDHIPDNVVNWVTTRNYGFSDAADLFIFISGWTVAFVYGRMMINRGYIIAATGIGKRARQINVAYRAPGLTSFAVVGVALGAMNAQEVAPEIPDVAR